jgi:ring-1,2-phenylacetyl-CoA epoxidase subunit PaaC
MSERSFEYLLRLADDRLVLGHRLSEWCGHAPILEEDIALANIALDLLGQARMLLTRAAAADASLRPASAPSHVPDEDALAYFRVPGEFRNVVVAEFDDAGDFAVCVARLLLIVAWRLAMMQRLTRHDDPVLRAIAAKAVPELTYHRDYAASWVVRLGDGTDESHRRMQAAVERLLSMVGELDEADPASADEVDAVLDQVLAAATLSRPLPNAVVMHGRACEHTDDLRAMLDDMQSVARADEDASW